jgi:hypothetical protein
MPATHWQFKTGGSAEPRQDVKSQSCAPGFLSNGAKFNERREFDAI